MDEVPSSRANARVGSDLTLAGAGQHEDTCALTKSWARAGPGERHRIV
jgi:hypothetical protein